MNDPVFNDVSKTRSCRLNPTEELQLQPRQQRFALQASYYDAARDDAYIKVADVTTSWMTDRHNHLMENNAAYRTFHIISVIFGAHDERTPEPYRGGLKRTLGR